MISWKFAHHLYFTFLQDIWHPNIRNNLIFSFIIGDEMSNIHFSALDNAKWLAKHISTKASFKITIRKRHVYIDIGWPWIWNQYFYLGIWNDDRTKIIVFPSFQLVTRINSQNRNDNSFINVLWHIILYMNISICNWHNWIFDPTNMKFFTLFQFLTRFLTSKYMYLFNTYHVGRNGALWITWISDPQNSKKDNLLKHKNQVHNRHFNDS